MGTVMVDFKSGLILFLLVFSYILPGCNSAESNEPNNEFDQEEIIIQLTQQLNESNKRIEQLSELMDESNQSSQMLQFQIDILQISLDLEKQNSLLQSISNNITISELQNSINSTQQLLAEANSIISQYESIDLATNTDDEYIPLLFETYNHSGRYMNHHNWNGGLWDRVIFDEYGIPKVQYSDGLKYVPTTAFHWGLVQYSKWIETQENVYFENATKIANWAVVNQSQAGGWAWFFNHSFHGGVLGSMDSGWYGGMTQGLGMSFLTRMYNATGNESYMDAALNSTKTLTINVSDGGVLRYYQNYSWYEEYPTPDAGSFVLNGYVYTLVGLYDLIEEFNDSLSIGLYQNGIISLSAMIGLFDLGCASSYDLVHHSVPGTAPNIAREGYHNLHITLISVMNAIEQESYQSIEDRWIDYANGICYSSPNGANPR